MKRRFLLLIGLTVSCSVFAKTKTADQATLYMISNIIKGCPAEFTKSLAGGESILEITSEETRNAQNLSVRTLVMTTGYAATPMNPTDQIQHKVTVVITAKAIQPLDGWREDISCAIAQGSK